MRGRTTDFVLHELEDDKPQQRRSGEGCKQVPTDTRSRSYSESLPGFFKRGQQYGELVDADPDKDSDRESDGNNEEAHFARPQEGSRINAEESKALSRPAAEGKSILPKDDHRPLENGNHGSSRVRHSPQKPFTLGGSKGQPGSKGATGTKTPPLPTKKTKMQTTDSDCSFEALQDTEGVSPGERGTINDSSDRMASSFSHKSPATPRSSEIGGGPIARSSPGLISQAARLAASFGQAPRKVMARRKTDDFSPMEEQHEVGKDWDSSEPSSWAEQSDLSRQKSDSLAAASARESESAKPRWVPEATSPGAGKPLLEKSRPPEATQISRGKQRQRAASFQLPSTKPSHMQPMLHALSARNATPNPRANSRVQHPTPQPARPVQDNPASSEAFDIFEPRPAPETLAQPAAAPTRKVFSVNNRDALAVSRSMNDVKCMKGHEALEVLKKGSVLKKKWLESNDAAEAQQRQKTERLIRCRLEKNRVVLHYYHQGMKGLLTKEEMNTCVQRVEVPDSNWQEGDCIILHTARGVLALAAPNAALHSVWVLGLNAALASCSTRGKDNLLTAPVRAIPRDSMFVVTPAL